MLNVQLLSFTPKAEEVVASAAKLCYSPVGVQEILEKLSEESTEKFIKKLLEIGHLSPFEHASFSFAVEGISRTATHQIVRHRLASYSQQSQRYVKAAQFQYIIPPQIEANKFTKEVFIKHMEDSQKAYDFIVDELIREKSGENPEDLLKSNPKRYSSIEKMAIEDARFVFPGAAETKIVITMNARSLMNFFEHRCCNRAQWEIRALADEMLTLVYKAAPLLFSKTGAPCTFGRCPEGVMSCGKVRKFEDIVVMK